MNTCPNVTETSKSSAKTEPSSGGPSGHAGPTPSVAVRQPPQEARPIRSGKNAERPRIVARFRSRFPAIGEIAEAATLFCLTAFFLFYGLVSIFGGALLGLVGADEPRHAQVAREMLARHDYVTP